MTGDNFTVNVDPEPRTPSHASRAQGSSAKKPQDARVLGWRHHSLLSQLSSAQLERRLRSTKGQPPQPMVQDNTDNNVQDLKNQLQAEQQKGEPQATCPESRLRTRRSLLRVCARAGLHPGDAATKSAGAAAHPRAAARTATRRKGPGVSLQRPVCVQYCLLSYF